MGFKEVQTLDADVTIRLGGKDKKTGKLNPQSIEGYYLGSRLVDSPKAKSGKASLHFFQTPKGNTAVWGKTDLDRKLSAVEPGTMVRASFDKMINVPTGEMYKYKVELDSSNTIPMDTIANETQSASSGYEEETPTEESYVDDAGGYDEDEAAQNAALLAAEARAAQQAKVQALLKKGAAGRK